MCLAIDEWVIQFLVKYTFFSYPSGRLRKGRQMIKEWD